MKEYPSIPHAKTVGEFDAHVFGKLDGNNIRIEYTRKQGFYKFGSRHRLLDRTDPQLGGALDVFDRDWREVLTKFAKDEHWNSAILFFEYHGPNSFAGLHVPNDPMRLTMFDAALDKKPMLGPAEFVKMFQDDFDCAPLLCKTRCNAALIERVYNSDLPGIPKEGVVCKGGSGHKIVRAKAKTKIWLDEVHSRYAPEEANKLAAS